MSIAQFNREFDVGLEDREFETVAGWILHEHGELPEQGTVIDLGIYSITIEEVEGNRMKTLAVRLKGPEGFAEEPEEGDASVTGEQDAGQEER